MRHLHVRQALGVHDVGLFDDAVAEQQERRQRVHLIIRQTPRAIVRHGAPDEIKDERRKRKVFDPAMPTLPGTPGGTFPLAMRAGGFYEDRRGTLLPIRPVAIRTPPWRPDQCSLRGA